MSITSRITPAEKSMSVNTVSVYVVCMVSDYPQKKKKELTKKIIKKKILDISTNIYSLYATITLC